MNGNECTGKMGMNVKGWKGNKCSRIKRELMKRNEWEWMYREDGNECTGKMGMNVQGRWEWMQRNEGVNIKVLLLRIIKKLSLTLKPRREEYGW